MESVSFLEPPPLIGTPKKQNLNKYCDYHGDRGHNTNDCYQLKKQIKEALDSGKLAHVVKHIRQNNQQSGSQGRNNVKVINMIREGGNHKRPFKEERSEGFLLTVGVHQRSCKNIASKALMFTSGQDSEEVELRWKKQNGANGVCDNKMLFAIQRHNRKDQNEKPQSVERLYGNANTWKGCKVHGRRKVRHPVWVANTIHVKLANGTWRVQVDYSSLNKVCAKDMYPFSEEGEELASLMGYPYKCFLRLPKKHSQIKMAEDDKEKTEFHTEEGALFHPHDERIKELGGYTLKDDGKGLSQSKRTKSGNILGRNSNKKQKNETISYVLLVEREGIQIPVSYVSRPLQGMEICYTPMEKMVQALIHTTRSLRAIFRKHKVKVVIDTPMEEILKLSGREGRLAKWVAERLYLGKETIEEGSGVGIILVSPDEKMHSYAIRLKFNTSDRAIDCEALLAGLAASVSKGMKDFHVFMDSPKLVAQIEGNHTPATEQERKYKKETLDATAPFHRFRITHLPKILNSKVEVLIGLATIKLEFLNQEVSVGIKTRPSVEKTSSNKKGKSTRNVPGAKSNYN
ncbi:reverse transcriptase domain-containing protein [Tanacetum coccineum]